MASPDVRLATARADDFGSVLGMLSSAELPTVGVADCFPGGYIIARSEASVIGVAGLEIYDAVGLLRSVAVQPDRRRGGLGRLLVGDRLRAARAQGLHAVYLLTTTAGDYFRRLGFEDTFRSGTPASLRASSEFATVCPESAVCLVRIVS